MNLATQEIKAPAPAVAGTNRRVKVTLVVIEVLLTGFALVMSHWATIPWVGTFAFAYLGGSTIVAELSPTRRSRRFWIWSLAGAWVVTLTVPLSCWLVNEERANFKWFLDYDYAVLAWLIAGMVLPALHRELGLKSLWKSAMIGSALAGNLIWIATSYLQNEWSGFHVGLLLALALLLICKLRFVLPSLGIQLANTAMLLVIGLLLISCFSRPDREFVADPQVLKKYYCYRTAKENWKAHDQWWECFATSHQHVENELLIKNPASLRPIRMRPNSRAKFLECDISINRLGFRGREISEAKGNTYRIVALGESTTFGFTIERNGKPWSEFFEEMVRERLKPDRPVEVINAGIPGITLPENFNRFPEEILPLKPDLIICYHGINGFSLMDESVPPLRGKPPPQYFKRPIRLLANSEYNLKLLIYKQTQSAKLFLKPPTFSNLLETKYAAAYADLIEIAKTNGIQLAIANFPLAVNPESPPEVVDFFRRRISSTYWYMRGNVAHNQLVRQLVQKHPEVTFVDTRPHIDGMDEKYLDLMHLTQEGDQQLAENFFAGLRPLLEMELRTLPTATEPAAK